MKIWKLLLEINFFINKFFLVVFYIFAINGKEIFNLKIKVINPNKLVTFIM